MKTMRGFTLVELIITIVILMFIVGIFGTGISKFVNNQGWTQERAEKIFSQHLVKIGKPELKFSSAGDSDGDGYCTITTFPPAEKNAQSQNAQSQSECFDVSCDFMSVKVFGAKSVKYVNCGFKVSVSQPQLTR